MSYLHAQPQRDITEEWFAARLDEQREAHEGPALRAWAEALLRELPDGPVDLVSTSDEGCAVAAVVAALHDTSPTRWRRIHLGRATASPDGYTTVVIEAVAVGDGLRASIRRSFPDACIFDGLRDREQSRLGVAA
jgi:hypothetical protein